MILLHQIIEVFDLPQLTAFGEMSFRLQFRERFGVGCIFVHIDDPWLCSMGGSKGFEQEVLSRLCVSRRAARRNRAYCRLNQQLDTDTPIPF